MIYWLLKGELKCMTKALMISIQPQHAVNILNGKKTLELRTCIPKGYVGWVYVYVTKGKPHLMSIYNEWELTKYKTDMSKSKNVFNGNGKVVFRFWFDEYDDITLNRRLVSSLYLDKLKLSYEQMIDYEKDKDLYAWHIKKLEIFDEPKELSDFYKRIDGLNENGSFILDNLKDGEYVTIPELKKKYLLSKAPQRSAWVYVYE